jgi:NADH:ubiquinone oxidoreductase subunit E
MSIATSAIERLQDVAGRAGGVTRADERATAAELHIPLAAVHGAATFYDDLAKTRRGRRHVRVCEGTACFAADGGQHVADVERALGVSVGACRGDGLVSLQAVRCIHAHPKDHRRTRRWVVRRPATAFCPGGRAARRLSGPR